MVEVFREVRSVWVSIYTKYNVKLQQAKCRPTSHQSLMLTEDWGYHGLIFTITAFSEPRCGFLKGNNLWGLLNFWNNVCTNNNTPILILVAVIIYVKVKMYIPGKMMGNRNCCFLKRKLSYTTTYTRFVQNFSMVVVVILIVWWWWWKLKRAHSGKTFVL